MAPGPCPGLQIGRELRDGPLDEGRAAPTGRCTIVTADGSTTGTVAAGGSQEPAPAPTWSTVVASPMACRIAAAIRGSGRRTERQPGPIVS
ncbi:MULTISPECIES: hypothetical protein [unclassified Pseudonocardia]|uniref:hypothetical protein n=1 Tax=unclassified Pseudonocardia TaxID=2619320 RepID=UPI0009630CE6|nr:MULTISPECIES: hypothetical protein [unclassified Pseudonocardia]MBN9097253.1 hypothetical protein [Pseudonocardia sp.]OJY39542.1 MAG: hypothetical protein BGP03_31000 [Pseudonocardia sp. 73-21]